jgi:hypothetical protein
MEVEPQSIVHQLVRLERKVTRMVKRSVSSKSSRRRKQINASLSANSCHSRTSKYTASSCDDSGVVSKDDSGDALTFAESVDEPTFDSSTPEEKYPIETHYGDCRTINQNEFFIECMINGTGTSSVVHFFDKENNLCREVDEALEKMAKKFTTCKFLRIDSAWTHFVSAKLGIEKFPTVLAIRDKVILDRLSDFEEMDLFFPEEFLDEWLVRTFPVSNVRSVESMSFHNSSASQVIIQ